MSNLQKALIFQVPKKHVFNNDDILPPFPVGRPPPVSLGKEGTRTVEIETVDHQRLEMTKKIVKNGGRGPFPENPYGWFLSRFPPEF